MTIEQLILAGYFIEAFKRLDDTIVIEAEIGNVTCIGQGFTIEEALADLNKLLE